MRGGRCHLAALARRCGLAALIGAALAAVADAQTVETMPPPRHGHFLGGLLTHQVRITLAPGQALDPASLPTPGPIDQTLTLVRFESEPLPDGARLTAVYQSFYAAQAATLRRVPGYDLRLGAGGTLSVPPFDFIASPLRPYGGALGPESLMPDPEFRSRDTAPLQAGVAAAAALALIGLTGLAWVQGWPPFHRRRDRPLARAAREIRRLARQGAPLPQLCRVLHRGLDQLHGATLLGADLDRLVAAHPGLGAAAPQLGAFFALSGRVFFGAVGAAPGPGAETATLVSLAQALARAEAGRG